MPRRQLRGVDEIAAALDAGQMLALLLVVETGASREALGLCERAAGLGIPVLRESERELRRMSAVDTPIDLLALEGRSPAASLDALMASKGVVFVLVGLRYPGNVGFILRCLEVAGGAGVVLDHDWSGAQREEALRIGMRADRFFPVLDAKAEDALETARRAGRRVVALETSGRIVPWQVDFREPLVVLVGGETTGIPKAILERADEVVAIPVAGFIPSYNVQAAVGIVLGEWLRQNT